MIHKVVIASDSSGDGSGALDKIQGWLQSVKVTYGGTPAATTDLTITETGGLQRNVLTLTDKNASRVYYPRAQASNPAGTDVAWYEKMYLSSGLSITLAQADASEAEAVTLLIEVLP